MSYYEETDGFYDNYIENDYFYEQDLYHKGLRKIILFDTFNTSPYRYFSSIFKSNSSKLSAFKYYDYLYFLNEYINDPDMNEIMFERETLDFKNSNLNYLSYEISNALYELKNIIMLIIKESSRNVR